MNRNKEAVMLSKVIVGIAGFIAVAVYPPIVLIGVTGYAGWILYKHYTVQQNEKTQTVIERLFKKEETRTICGEASSGVKRRYMSASSPLWYSGYTCQRVISEVQ